MLLATLWKNDPLVTLVYKPTFTQGGGAWSVGLYLSKQPDNKLALAFSKATNGAIFQLSAFHFNKILHEIPSGLGKKVFFFARMHFYQHMETKENQMAMKENSDKMAVCSVRPSVEE